MQRDDHKQYAKRIDDYIQDRLAGPAIIDLEALISTTLEECEPLLNRMLYQIKRFYIQKRVWAFQKRAQHINSAQGEMFPDLKHLPQRIHFLDENHKSISVPFLSAHKGEWKSFKHDYQELNQQRVDRKAEHISRMDADLDALWARYGADKTIGQLLELAVAEKAAAAGS